jgi:hypothetical protein
MSGSACGARLFGSSSTLDVRLAPARPGRRAACGDGALGHSQISLTLNTYSHVIPALGRAAADQMDAVLGPRSADTAAG